MRKTPGHISDAEKLARVAIGVGALAARDGGEIGGELGLLETRGHHVGMRRRNVAPRAPDIFAVAEIEVRLLRRSRRLDHGDFGRDAERRRHRLGLVVDQRLEARGGLRIDRFGDRLDGDQITDRIFIGNRAARVRRGIARVERKRNMTADDSFQAVAEHALPIVDHRLQERVGVEGLPNVAAGGEREVVTPLVGIDLAQAALDVGLKDLGQHQQRLIDALIGGKFAQGPLPKSKSR